MMKQLQWPCRLASCKPFYGWLVAASAMVAICCSAPGQSYGFAVFIDAILKDTGLSRTQISGLYALGTGVSAVTTLVIGRLVDHWGARRVLAIVGIAIGAACFVMAGAQGALSVLLGFAVLRALGQGSISMISTLLVAQWFLRYRGRAMALVQLGGAASNALFPPLALSLIMALGWRDAYRVIGVGQWLVLIPLAVFIVRNRPESMGLHVDGSTHLPESINPEHSEAPPDARLWQTRQFWQIVLPLTVRPFVVTALILHQTSIFASRGLPSTVAAVVFVPLAIASASMSALAGVVVDRVGPRNVLFSSLGFLFLALLQLQVLSTPLGATIYALTIGAVIGISGVADGVIWAHYYGRAGLGHIQGMASMVMITAAAIAPLPLAALQSKSGSYSFGLGLFTLLPLIGALILAQVEPLPSQQGQAVGAST